MATQIGVGIGYVECTNGVGTSLRSNRKIEIGLAQINKHVLVSDYLTSSKSERKRMARNVQLPKFIQIDTMLSMVILLT
jgi:hypothetical protein